MGIQKTALEETTAQVQKLDWALKYAAIGWHVHPLVPGAKIPPSGGKGLLDATTDPARIKKWWGDNPNYNIGIRCGQGFGVMCLDVDNKNGKNGFEWIKAQAGDLPITAEQITPSGGRQYIFKAPNELIPSSAGSLAPGIDIRGEGGYFLIPPSNLIATKEYRFSGTYEWLTDQAPFEIELALAPDWLLKAIKESAKSERFKLPSGEIPQGKQDNTLFRYACSLKSRGQSPSEIRSKLIDELKRCPQDQKNPFTNKDIDRWINTAFGYPDEPKGAVATPAPDENKAEEASVAISGGTLNLTEKEVRNCNQIADIIQSENTFIHCDDYYEYKSGVFLKITEGKIKKLIKDKIKGKFNKYIANEILHSLQVDIGIDSPDELNATDLLNLKNGMFNLETLELFPHSPDYKSTIQLPVSYDPKAECVKWFEALQGMFPDDIDKADMIQEFFGLCLTKETKYEKALFLVGEGANGKSTILHILQLILGKRNYCSIPLEMFNNAHYTANFFNRLANISIETNAKSSVYDSLMKAVISGDTISADLKYHNVMQFNPFCKLIFALNSMPRVDDKTDAFYRRLIIVRFNRQFEEEEQNKNLKHELEAEMDEIFSWMVKGLKRLRDRGYFDIPAGMKKEIAEYRADNNNVLTFIDDECVLEPNAVVTKKALYFSYSEWCKTNNYGRLALKKFGKELIKHFHGKITDGHDGSDRVWFGVEMVVGLKR